MQSLVSYTDVRTRLEFNTTNYNIRISFRNKISSGDGHPYILISIWNTYRYKGTFNHLSYKIKPIRCALKEAIFLYRNKHIL